MELPQLQIIGRGSCEQALRALVVQLGLSNKVEFFGLVPESDKFKLLESAEMAVYPSLGGEGFGYVLVETLSLGVPLIAGNIDAYAETLAGSPGVLVDTRSSRELAEAIKSLLRSSRASRLTAMRESIAHATAFDVERIGPYFSRTMRLS